MELIATDSDASGGVLAFDVGGANLKAADGRGDVHAESFELWRRPTELAGRIAAIAAPRRPRRIVATMTGEIADCFADRAAGVRSIVDALRAAAGGMETDLGIYAVDGRIVTAAEAVSRPALVAASNWHALARLAAVAADRDRALLVDVGSTTTDILLLDRRGPLPLARDDPGRMASGELVYTGIERTPVAGIVRSLPFGGRRHRLASERYACSRDVWVLVGALAEAPDSTDTCDGRPATRDASRVRLARMALLDPELVDEADARIAAERCAEVQARQVAGAIRTVLGRHGVRPERIILSGHGTPLAERALDRASIDAPRLSLEARLGPALSRAAPAHALALIALGVLR